MRKEQKEIKIAVIGLGYVGLPLAVAFSNYYQVTGFDIKQTRINELLAGKDSTLEVSTAELSKALSQSGKLRLSSDLKDISACNFYIVTVPTPVDKQKFPDLSALHEVSKMIGSILEIGDVVVYESTVYPGATEDECVPTLAKYSGLRYNVDFFVGYSPERVNPGDPQRSVQQITKVTSGSTPESAHYIDSVYARVIEAGTHLAPSIKVAEAAKVIENAQRDVNIAFVNELAQIFNRLEIDTEEVLEAAATKWNFLSFKPGLVGGHCIGVDPYYLAERAQKAGYYPQVILSGRKINDGMGEYIGHEVVKLMVKREISIKGSKALILGFTFKESCPDVRNTKVYDIVQTLADYGIEVAVYDPWADADDTYDQYQISLLDKLPDSPSYDAIILAVAHPEFKGIKARNLLKKTGVLYDVKAVLPKEEVDARL